MPECDARFLVPDKSTHHLFAIAGSSLAVRREHHGVGHVTDHLRICGGLPLHIEGTTKWTLSDVIGCVLRWKYLLGGRLFATHLYCPVI